MDKRRRLGFRLLGAAGVLAIAGMSAGAEVKMSEHVFKGQVVTEVTLKYMVHTPADYEKDTAKRWPMILSLHGAGERGEDLQRVKIHGVAKIAEQTPDFPFIVVSPLCPADKWWEPEPLAALLDEVEKKWRVDKDRIYVTGLSMGGFGTWGLAIQYPDRFAAIAPICGGGNPLLAARIKHVPTWVFHGDDDKVVPIVKSQEMVDALKRAGADVKFTIYPGVGHDSWTETYRNPELYEWFLKQNRAANAARQVTGK